MRRMKKMLIMMVLVSREVRLVLIRLFMRLLE